MTQAAHLPLLARPVVPLKMQQATALIKAQLLDEPFGQVPMVQLHFATEIPEHCPLRSCECELAVIRTECKRRVASRPLRCPKHGLNRIRVYPPHPHLPVMAQSR